MLQMLNFILRAMGSQPGKNFEQSNLWKINQNISWKGYTVLRAYQVAPVVKKKKKKNSACQCRRKRHRFDPWVRKIPWRRGWQPTPIFLPGESHGQRSLAG